ncbi:MAG: transcription elongation factor GreA [Chloroflexi bacterium]|nr:transcription elongation factor GreA [Chloroflexota bacterium]
MNTPTYLTAKGKAALEAELAELTGPKRTELSIRLKNAIEMGDLSENADYKAAKEDQGFLEGRIQELENILFDAIIVDEPDADNKRIQIGNIVTFKEGDEPEETYELVGATESNARQHKISYESPIGAALLGHKKGDKVEVKLPNGQVIILTIVSFE